MTRYEVINLLIQNNSYKSYLEIGVDSGECFRSVRCETKQGVDPNSNHATHKMTSDYFFKNNLNFYDIIFIDGLHTFEQVKLDIQNSLSSLSPDGSIVLHDCLPKEKWHQERQQVLGKPWTGDVWKAFSELRFTRADLFMTTIDCDWGCGIIKRGNQELCAKPPVLDWDYFTKNNKFIMNVVSEKEWITKIYEY